MPRIPPKTLDSVCYLYHTEADARAGKDFGGTAFLVSIEAEVAGHGFVYAVTNWHVACKSGASVLRINRHNGDSDILSLDPGQWDFDPRYDIAVKLIALRPGEHAFSLVPAPRGFVTMEDIRREKLGPGEDVFMVGRFVDHDGGPINRPSVRFGNISVMPSPIEQPNGKMADSYCIDLHSRSGYSGSPVFVYRTPGYDLEERLAPDTKSSSLLFSGTNYLKLLGIHFSQFIEEWEIGDPRPIQKGGENRVPLIRDGQYVKGLSGMTCVLPAWMIWEVLNLSQLVEQRKMTNDQLQAQLPSEKKGSL